MCGRYTLIADIRNLAQRFEFDGADFSYDPGYNIAPTESVLTVKNVEGREAAFMKWGLIPFWAKDPKIGGKMINARAKTVQKNVAKKWVVAANTGVDHHQIQERHTDRRTKASKPDSTRHNEGAPI